MEKINIKGEKEKDSDIDQLVKFLATPTSLPHQTMSLSPIPTSTLPAPNFNTPPINSPSTMATSNQPSATLSLLSAPNMSAPGVPNVPLPTVKPKDIPMLESYQLQGLDAAARLQMFCELVEQSHNTDVGRIQVAKGRVSTDLAILIHNHQTKKSQYLGRS